MKILTFIFPSGPNFFYLLTVKGQFKRRDLTTYSLPVSELRLRIQIMAGGYADPVITM